MRTESVKLLIDACAEAAHLPQVMPPLPKGVTPRMVRVVEQIAIKTGKGESMPVSDISEMLDVTRPGITTVLRELHSMGYVTKTRDEQDRRIVYVALTETGRSLYQRCVVEFHQKLTKVLVEFSDEDAERFAAQLHRIMDLFQSYTDSLSA